MVLEQSKVIFQINHKLKKTDKEERPETYDRDHISYIVTVAFLTFEITLVQVIGKDIPSLSENLILLGVEFLACFTLSH